MPQSEPQDLAEAFSEIARELHRAGEVEDTLQAVVEMACKTVDHCVEAGVTIVDLGSRTKVHTPAQTSERVSRVDEVQSELEEGPCLSAIEHHEIFYADSLGDDPRWPNFGPRAAEEGLHSLLSFRLFVDEKGEDERTIGALNLYSDARDAFDEDDHHLGLIFASHASVAIAAAQAARKRNENKANLELALESRDVIGQAKGILMAHQGVSADEAFDILRRASQRANTKLRDMAQRVVDRQGEDTARREEERGPERLSGL